MSAGSSGSTLRSQQQRSGSVRYSGPGSVSGCSSTRLRPYSLTNRSLKAYVSGKWNRVSKNMTGTVRSMRLIKCASTTPPPPKLTVRVTLRGNVTTAHLSTVSGSAPHNARACSRISVRLNIRPALEVLELDEAIDHAGSAVLQRLLLGVDHELRLERRFVGVRDARELGDLARPRPALKPR